MRIARFAADGDPQYGVVELAEDGGSTPAPSPCSPATRSPSPSS